MAFFLAEKLFLFRTLPPPQVLELGSQTRIDRRSTFQRKNAPSCKKTLTRAANYMKSFENKLNLIKIYNIVNF